MTQAVIDRDDADHETAPTPSDAIERKVVLRVDDLSKSYRRQGGARLPVVRNVSLEVRAGEVLVLLGPSGCGKTTLLRCIAGLETPDSGRIEIHGGPILDSQQRVDVPTNKRGLSMIFQSYALWPHMTAFDNVAYPLRVRRAPRRQIEERVVEILELVGIAELRGRHPSQMSGGQQQRVALARALVSNDELVLFDEPLSNVDARVREQLRNELAEMQQRLGFAAVYVTHDQVEALSLAHRIAVLSDGSVDQLGTPEEIYDAPTTRQVANFVGTTNEVLGVVDRLEGDDAIVNTDIGVLRATSPARLELNESVIVTCRPEMCTLSEQPGSGQNEWLVEARSSMFLGSHVEHVVSAGEHDFRVWLPPKRRIAIGARYWLSVPTESTRALRR